jgi:hypothetical protein
MPKADGRGCIAGDFNAKKTYTKLSHSPSVKA